MCNIGDIILIENYKDGGNLLNKHSFVVLDNTNGQIEGMSYDLVCNVLSSFKNEEQKKRKLSYPGNFPISNSDTVTNPDNGKDGYLKTDQLYYFNSSNINYKIIGNVLPDILQLIFDFIQQSSFAITEIIDNLK